MELNSPAIQSILNSLTPEKKEKFQQLKIPLYCDGCHNLETTGDISTNLGEGADLKCSRCKSVYYCSSICQKNHWKLHKPICSQYSLFFEEFKERELEVKKNLIEKKFFQNYSSFLESSTTPSPSLSSLEDENKEVKYCEICYEIFENPLSAISPKDNGGNDSSVTDCPHHFCFQCIQSFYDQLIDPKVTELESISGSRPDDSDFQQKKISCPLCRTNDIEPALWTYAYTNANDFLFQWSLYPKNSSLAYHFLAMAEKEYLRLQNFLVEFPSDLTPLQYDALYLQLLVAKYQSFMAEPKDETNKAYWEDKRQKVLSEILQFANGLLNRELKDIVLIFEIYKEFIRAFFELNEFEKAKNECETVFTKFAEFSNASQKNMKMSSLLNSSQNQKNIHLIHQLYLEVLFELHDYHKVIELSEQALQKDRHDMKAYLLQAKAFNSLHDWTNGILTCKFAFRYMFPWNQEIRNHLEQVYQLLLQGFSSA